METQTTSGQGRFQKITPFLWFDDQAEDAVNFYTAVFKNAAAGVKTYYPEGSMLPAGTLLTQSFELEGIQFVALNGGPKYHFNPSISFVVNCEDQAEIDYFWEQLSQNGRLDMCGWLTDQFGVSWQVVPATIGTLMKHPKAAMALMQMQKIEIAVLENAANQ